MTVSPQGSNADTSSDHFRNPTLEDAWRRFADYDKNAVIAQKRFFSQRKWIISLGVLTTTLAVFYLVIKIVLHREGGQEGAAVEEVSNLTKLFTDLFNGEPTTLEDWFLGFLDFSIIVIPIIVTVLIAIAVKFNMGANWIVLRSSAENLKKEIYRYRVKVDIYSDENCKVETRDIKLAHKIKIVGMRVMETQVNQRGLDRYSGKLPPLYGAYSSICNGREDDGFSDLTADEYLAWRLEDQFDYYCRKSKKLDRELSRFQWLIYILGGIGTLLAAMNLEIWVAVSSAFASALSSFLEFKRVETNLVSCNQAASDLYDIRAWWRSLPVSAKNQQMNIETLVSTTESVIQSENASWVQEMRDALSEIYGEGEGTESEEEGASVEDEDDTTPDSGSDDQTTSTAIASSSPEESNATISEQPVS
jgi:hypothetical protein